MLVSEASEYIPCQTIAVVGRRSTLPVPRTSQKSQQTMPHDVFMAPLLEVRAWLLRPVLVRELRESSWDGPNKAEEFLGKLHWEAWHGFPPHP